MKFLAPTHRYLLAAICPLVALTTMMACLPVQLDSLITVNAPRPFYRFRISKHIRGSELWRAYLEHLASKRGGSEPVVSIDIEFERKITDDEQTGDYDAGVVYAHLELTELLTGTTLLTHDNEFEIPNHVFVQENATREEVQDAAFASIEEDAVSDIILSMDLALIRTMGREGSLGTPFIAALEDVQQRHWSVTLKQEAGSALDAIRASLGEM